MKWDFKDYVDIITSRLHENMFKKWKDSEIQGAADWTPTLFVAFDLSVDDKISLFRLFPFPYKLQFHRCKAWLDLRVLFNPRPLFLFKQPPVLFAPLKELLIQATFDLEPHDLVPRVDRKTIISLFIHFEPVVKTTARLHTRTIFRWEGAVSEEPNAICVNIVKHNRYPTIFNVVFISSIDHRDDALEIYNDIRRNEIWR